MKVGLSKNWYKSIVIIVRKMKGVLGTDCGGISPD